MKSSLLEHLAFNYLYAAFFRFAKDVKLKRVLRRLVIFMVPLSILGCSGTPPKDADDWNGYTETGRASFYANKHHNERTACGERNNQDLKTSAHRNSPYGSKLKVTNVNNGMSVVAQVNDRGPFVNGGIVDLSKSAFSNMGIRLGIY